MQKIRILAFVLVLGALVASPTSAATDAESFSLAALFHMEDGVSTGLNDTVYETTKGEAAAGNNSQQELVEENTTAGTGPFDETDPAANGSHAATEIAREASRMVSGGSLAGELYGPYVQKQRSSDEKPGDKTDDKDGKGDGGTGGGVGMQTQSGAPGPSPAGGDVSEVSLPVDPYKYFPNGDWKPKIVDNVQNAWSPPYSFDAHHDVIPGSYSPPGFEPDPESNDLPGISRKGESEVQSMTQTVYSFQSAAIGETSGRSDSATPNDPFRPTPADHEDSPGSMGPKATIGGVYPAEPSLGSLPVALGVLAGLAVLTFRPEIFLKPLQLLGLRLFTHIRKDSVLKHEKRNRIYTIIQQNPGIQAPAVAETFGLSPDTVRYHVDVLSRHEKVVMFREGKKVFFYPAEMASTAQRFEELKAVPDPVDQAIVQFLKGAPTATQRQIADTLGLNYNNVSRRICTLARKGVAVAEKARSAD